jgi:hypothetical protein
MSDRPRRHSTPQWEKPDFEVMPLTDLEALPGFGHDDGIVIAADAERLEGDDTVDLRGDR